MSYKYRIFKNILKSVMNKNNKQDQKIIKSY